MLTYVDSEEALWAFGFEILDRSGCCFHLYTFITWLAEKRTMDEGISNGFLTVPDIFPYVFSHVFPH